jgi:hypothetical protein
VKVKEEIQKEQEIQEKRAKEKKEREEKEEKERQEKTEFATFLNLTPKNSSDLEQMGTPSPQKEQDENKIRKRSLRKSWEMTKIPSPIKNRQYLKPQNITPKNLNLNPAKKRILSPAKKPSSSLSPSKKLILSPKKIFIPKKIFVDNTPEVRQRSSRTVKTPLRFTENCESYFNGNKSDADTDSDSNEQPSAAKKIRKTLISSPKKIFIPEKKVQESQKLNALPDPDFNDDDSNFEPPKNTDSDSDVLSAGDSDEPYENIRKNNSSPKKKVYERKKLNASADSDFTLDESNFEPPPEIPPPTEGVNERPKVIKLTKRLVCPKLFFCKQLSLVVNK